MAKRCARAFEHDRVLRGEVDQVYRMNRKRPEPGLFARFSKLAHFIARKLAREPASRISREDLKAVAAFRNSRMNRVCQTASYRSMHAYNRSSLLHDSSLR